MKSSLLDTLSRLSKMSWQEAYSLPKENGISAVVNSGEVQKMKEKIISSIKKYENNALTRVEDLAISAARFSQKSRIYRYRDGKTFYVCFVDKNHDLLDY